MPRQVPVAEKSYEIIALSELLALLDVTGCIVTIDAMRCQKEIARQIIGQGSAYVWAFKGNQGTFHADVQLFPADSPRPLGH